MKDLISKHKILSISVASAVVVMIVIAGVIGGSIFLRRNPPTNSFGESAGRKVETTENLLRDIAFEFSPILALHPQESFEPVNVEIVLGGKDLCGSGLWQRDGGVLNLIKACLGAQDLEDHQAGFYIDIDGLELGDADGYRAKYLNLKPKLKNVMYSEVFAFEDQVVIDYWMFYFYNDWAGNDRFYVHEGDWERVRVIVNAAPDKARSADPYAILYSRHECDAPPDMDARLWTDLPASSREGKHAIVFVGLGSHAGFPTNGILGIHSPITEYCVHYDITSPRGTRIRAQEIVLIDCVNLSKAPLNLSWLRFKGQWGGDDGSPDGPCVHAR